MFLLGLAAQAAGALIKGLSDRHDARQAKKAAKKAVGYDLEKLVQDAQRSGFNPLTVLNATGGANYARLPMPTVPGLGQAVASGLSQAAGSIFDQSQFQAALNENARQFDVTQFNRLYEPQSYSAPSSATHFGGASPSDPAFEKPWDGWMGDPLPVRGTPEWAQWALKPVPVFQGDAQIAIPQGYAYTNRFNPWDTLGSEDIADFGSESMGEAAGWLNAGAWLFGNWDAPIADTRAPHVTPGVSGFRSNHAGPTSLPPPPSPKLGEAYREYTAPYEFPTYQ